MDRYASVHAATTGTDLVRLRAVSWREVTQRAVMVAAGHQAYSDDYVVVKARDAVAVRHRPLRDGRRLPDRVRAPVPYVPGEEGR